MPSFIYVRTQFEGYHCWENAPEGPTAFLRNVHRHLFHVKLTLPVSHNDRQLEFFAVKAELDLYIERRWTRASFTFSCEQIAEELLKRFPMAVECEVSEDGENGAIARTSTTERWKEIAPPLPEPSMLPAMQKKTKCFVGIEAEGPHRGDVVLFVPASCTPQRIEKSFATAQRLTGNGIQRIYLGAGNDYSASVPPEILHTIARIAGKSIGFDWEHDAFHRTFHKDFWNPVPSWVFEPSSITFIWRSPSPQQFTDEKQLTAFAAQMFEKHMTSQYIKLFYNNAVYWIGASGFCHRTELNDDLFAQDRYVE